ncbi:hypothetical protein [Streptomyces antibioticus]|uniref:hypothetical protein n=1 Tax=Streptomyces antibioticus TaxID=1890 RepID=UPI0033FC04C0
MTACAHCFSTNGHHVHCPNFQTTALATTQAAPTGPTVWVLATGEDHEGGEVLGVYASKEAAKGPFVEAAKRIPFDLDRAWQDEESGAVHAHGGCDWVSLEPHPLIGHQQLT